MIEKQVVLLMNEEITQTIKSLKMRHINRIYATDREEAQAKIFELIPQRAHAHNTDYVVRARLSDHR